MSAPALVRVVDGRGDSGDKEHFEQLLVGQAGVAGAQGVDGLIEAVLPGAAQADAHGNGRGSGCAGGHRAALCQARWRE